MRRQVSLNNHPFKTRPSEIARAYFKQSINAILYCFLPQMQQRHQVAPHQAPAQPAPA